MGRPLKLLIVDDNEDDALLIARDLRRAGYDLEWRRVDTAEAMSAALEEKEWDAITSDNTMPHFSGAEALRLAKQGGRDIPFLIVSGTIGEEAAVDSMRNGVHDYLLKDNLTRLAAALDRELREAENRRAQRGAAEQLEKEQQFQRAVLDGIDAGIVACDARGVLTLFNRVAAEMHGMPAEPIDSHEWAERYGLYSSDGHTLLRDEELPLVRALGGERVRNLQLVIRPRDRPARTLLVTAQPIIDSAGHTLGAVAVLNDISELTHAQEELQRQREALFQSEKLAAMGQLLAGVAHELNNPLSVVMGQSTLLERALGGGPEAVRADKIVKAAERCARIVRNFLALARQRPPERERVAFGQVVGESLELLAYSLRVEGIEVRLDLARDLPTLWADSHQLQQLLINLITNAQHALRGVPTPHWIAIKAHCEGGSQRLVIEVTDNGSGIPPELRSQIFDLFFTTKAPGEGTGLGLPLCRGIVEGHGGTLSVESEPGRGALFRVELPIEDPPRAAESATQAVPAPSPKGGESILLVDDDAQVAEMLAEMLRDAGHLVEIAGNGIEALQKLEQASFDLIVSDLRMPRLDGRGLLREAERQHPGLAKRFVFTSGDVLAPGTLEFLESTQVPHLTKPFVLNEVLRVVNQALEVLRAARAAEDT